MEFDWLETAPQPPNPQRHSDFGASFHRWKDFTLAFHMLGLYGPCMLYIAEVSLYAQPLVFYRTTSTLDFKKK